MFVNFPRWSDDVPVSVAEIDASGVSDGLLCTEEGIYVSALETGSIKLVDKDGVVSTVVADPRILWPDSFARDPHCAVLFTTSQIHLESPTEPYRVLRIVTR